MINKTGPIRAALYARTSRAGQHIDVQLAQLRQVAEQRGWQVISERVDDEVSSRRRSRPQLEAMLQAARAGELDVVAAVALDRYARSVHELLDLGERLSGWGVDMISLRESIDTSTAVGKMTFTVLAAVAEFERELIRERTLAGLDQARRRGKTLGRPRVEVDADQVAQLRATGTPWATIAKHLGVSESSCRRATKARFRGCQNPPRERPSGANCNPSKTRSADTPLSGEERSVTDARFGQ